jgi:hypothetical protein
MTAHDSNEARDFMLIVAAHGELRRIDGNDLARKDRSRLGNGNELIS